MMVIWRITGNEIGPDGNGAAHFATQKEATAAIAEYQADATNIRKGWHQSVFGPTRIIVKNRAMLASAMDDAMGFGCS